MQCGQNQNTNTIKANIHQLTYRHHSTKHKKNFKSHVYLPYMTTGMDTEQAYSDSSEAHTGQM